MWWECPRRRDYRTNDGNTFSRYLKFLAVFAAFRVGFALSLVQQTALQLATQI